MRTSKPAAWFRLYAEFATDPKVQMLSEVDQRRFLMLLCIRCGNGDVTLHDDEVAFQLRISNDEWVETKSRLMGKNLIDEDSKPVAWDKRQYASDSSTERVSRHRERVKRGCNVTVTPPETETETEIKAEKPTPANAVRLRVVPGDAGDFTRFWVLWPKRVGKQEAMAAWRKLAPDLLTLDAVMAGVERVLADPERWRKDGRDWQLLPDPVRWLRHRRWEDDMPVAAAAYSPAEASVIDAYNACLPDCGWPVAMADPFSLERAAAIRAFVAFNTDSSGAAGYFRWMAKNLQPIDGLGFDWSIRQATYLRAREGNFAALRDSA